MTEPPLPDDPAGWPTDPYRLLGVERGTPAREIRRAYHALIRRFKPEHAPEAFRRLREAFEATQRGDFAALIREAVANRTVAARAEPTPEPEPTPAVDCWEEACAGEVAAAYRGLAGRLEREPRAEDVFLQLYWLAVVAPEVAPDLTATAWLVRGLRACGPHAWRLRELLRRAAEVAPAAATEPAWAGLLIAGTPPELVEFAAECRWRGARLAGRFAAIVADVAGLRGWLPEADPAAAARLLLLAAADLAWGTGPHREAGRECRAAAERLAYDHALDVDDELTRYEYADAVTTGLCQRGWAGVGADGLADLLRHAWNRRGAEFPALLRAFAERAARDPAATLVRLDTLRQVAPAALGLFWEALGGDGGGWPDPPTTFAATAFVATTRWGEYPTFRPKLLAFCVRERVAPVVVARAVEDLPGLILPGHLHLALVIAADWPLLATYRTCEVARA